MPQYPGVPNGAVFRHGDVAIADANFHEFEHGPFPIRFYSLIDGSGWLHDFDSDRPGGRTVKAVPFQEEEEAIARRQMRKLDEDAANIVREKESLAGVVNRSDKVRESAARRATEAREHKEQLEREERERVEREAAAERARVELEAAAERERLEVWRLNHERARRGTHTDWCLRISFFIDVVFLFS